MEMTDEEWNAPHVRSFGVILFGDSIDVDDEGEEISGTRSDAVQRGSRPDDPVYACPVSKRVVPGSGCWTPLKRM
jgi:isoamylase